MPTYSIQGPDGKTYSIDGPPGATREQVIQAIQARMSEPEPYTPPPPPPPPKPEGGLFPSVARGFLQTSSLIGDILPGMIGKAVGAEEFAQRQFKEAAETEKKIQAKYAPEVASYKDIKGVGDFFTYVTESVGELIPSIIPSLVTGGAAGIIGRGATIAAKEAAEAAARKGAAQGLTAEAIEQAAREAGIKAAQNTALKYQAVGAISGSALQNVPEVYKNVKDETGQDSIGTALLFGGFNSLLDAALPISLLAKARKAGIPNEQIVGEWYKRFGKGALKGYATEGATEAAQEMSSAAAEKFVDNNIEFFSEKNLERFINAGLKGGLGGGVVSGAMDVVTGRRPYTQDELVKDLREGETLEQGISRVQAELMASREALNELRQEQAESGRTRLNDEALSDLGLNKKDPIYQQILNKDINDPAQAAEVIAALNAGIADPAIKDKVKGTYANTIETIKGYAALGEQDVGASIGQAGGEGVGVAGLPSDVAPAEGVGQPQRVGVAPSLAAAEQVDAGAGLQQPTLAAPEVAAATAEPPAATAEPAVEFKPEEIDTQSLIAQQEERVTNLTNVFQGLLKEQINRFGLKDVALKVVDDLKNANGTYSKGLIQMAVDATDPVRDLKHESVHALKELGFFTDAQWNTLVNTAKSKWIDEFMRNRSVNGQPLQEGQQSRYDAYLNLYQQQGLDAAQIEENIIEEAIADAFGSFAATKPPPGLMSAILNRMRNFFSAIKGAVGMAKESDPETAEAIFGKVAKGELKAPAAPEGKPKAPKEPEAPEAPEAKVATEAEEAEKPAPEEVAPKPSIKGEVTPPSIDNSVIEAVVKKMLMSKEMVDSTSLGMQTGKSGKEQFEKQDIGGIPEIISFLERRRLESGLPPLDIEKPEDRRMLADLLTAEALASINAGGAALEWYDETVAKTIGMAALKYKQLADDPDQQMLFRLATAISSQGLNVEDNLSFAMRQYDYYTRFGKFEEIGTGTDASQIKANFMLANRLIDKYKLPQTRKFLATAFKAEDLRSAGFEIGGELGDEMVLGSSVFGPKIGFGFYSNLGGNFEPVTMDMWFMRLIGRLTGKLRLLDESLLEQQLVRFRKAFDQTGDNGVYADLFKPEVVEAAKTNKEDAIEFARIVNSVFNSDFLKNRELYNEKALVKTELVYAAQRIINSVKAPKDAPSNGTERRQLRDVVNKTVDKVESITGRRIPPAALQALVWYPEQELYSALGAKLRVTSQDYAGAMKKILKGEGYGEQQLNDAATDGARAVRAMAGKPKREAVGPVGEKPGAAFQPEQREEFLEERRVERVIEEERVKPKRHKVVFEIAPDPSNDEVVNQWRGLTQDQRLLISKKISNQLLPQILEGFNAKGRVASQVGSYLDDTNPSFALYLDKGNPVDISKYLGYILSQDSMMVISPRPSPGLDKVGAVVIDLNTQDPEAVDSVYQRLRQIRVNGEQLVGGQSTINGKMVVLNYSNLSTVDLTQEIANALQGKYDVSHTDVYSAFPEKADYEFSDPKNDPRGEKGTLRSAARNFRGEATRLLAQELGLEAEAKPKAPEQAKPSLRAPDTQEFKQFIAGSKAVDENGRPLVFYHGSLRDKTVFRGKIAGAIFLAPDPSFAEGYIQYKIKELAERPGQYLSKEEVRAAVRQLRQYVYDNYGRQSKAAKDFLYEITEIEDIGKKTGEYNFRGELGDAWRGNESQMGIIEQQMLTGRNITPVYVNVQRPFDYEKRSDINAIIRKMADRQFMQTVYTPPKKYKRVGKALIPVGESEKLKLVRDDEYPEAIKFYEDRYLDKLKSGDFTTIESPEVVQAIKDAGFDGFYVKEEHTSGPAKNLAVFNSNQIKSAIGNVGTFGQRLPTDTELERLGMFPQEAAKAQAEGDIRFSLKAHKDFFDKAEDIPMSEGVETIRENWIGGVSGLGDRDAMYDLYRVAGGKQYTAAVRKFISDRLGPSFKGYRLMSKDELEELETGAMGAQFVSFSLNPDVAKAFRNLPSYAKRKDLVVVEMDLTPDHVHMVGHPGEQELVIDYGEGYNPTEIKVITDEKFSLKAPDTPEFKRWFGDSKIVNEDGTPKVMYHGTALNFSEFAPGERNAIFVTDNPQFASFFAGLSDTRNQVEIAKKIDAYPDVKRDLITRVVDTAIDSKALATKENSGGLYDITREEHINNFMDRSLTSSMTSVGIGPQLTEIIDNLKEAGPNVMPVYVSASNPFDYENTRHISKLTPYVDLGADIKRGIRSGSWRAIESEEVQNAIKSAGFDAFYIKEQDRKNLAVYKPNQIKSATGNVGTFDVTSPDIRFSLRSQLPASTVARIEQTTTARKEEGFIERITSAFKDPDARSKARAQALNRYNRLGEYDKMKMERAGGMDLYADVTAESAALMSDLGAGVLASAFGVHDKVGGVPVYNRQFIVQKVTSNGMFTQIGKAMSSKAQAEQIAKKYGGEVRETGYTAVSNLNNTVKGPLAIFAPLMEKYKDPEIFRIYQFWAGVKRAGRFISVPQPGGGFKVEERNFNDPGDIAKAKDIERRFPEFVDVQKEWVKYNNGLVKFMLDTGVISKAQAIEFTKHGDYFPFYRQAEDSADAIGPRVFQSIAGVQAPRKIKHGEDPLGDFFENMVRNSQAAIQAGLKNVAARRAADVGMDIGTVQRLPGPATGANVFYVMENGEKVYYDSSDILFVEAMKSLGLPNVPFIGLLAAPANILRNLVTKDPGFMLANMMRDSLSAWATSGVKMTPMVATLANFGKAVAGSSPELDAMYKSGILGGYDYSQNVMDSAKEFKSQIRKQSGVLTKGEKALRPATWLWDALEKGTSASDAATRIEVYKDTLARTGNEAEALFRSLEVMNFNRKGANPIIRIATAAIPFLNARMQGLDVLYRAGFGANATKNAKEIQRNFFIRGMTMAALSSLYWLLTHDDEEYKKQEQEVRDNNWLFPALGIRIPIPFEVGVLFKVIPERILGLTFGQDTAKDFTQSMIRQATSTFGLNPIPQAALPIVETMTNYSFFTGRPIVSKGLEDVAPAYQVGPGTSRLAEELGAATKGLPSYLQISPVKLDQLINGYTGTMGMYMVNIMDSIYDLNSDRPKPSMRVEQYPVIKRFILDKEARGQVSAYYDLKNSVDTATRTSNLLERTGRPEEYGPYIKDNAKMLATKDYVLDMYKTLRDLNEMKVVVRTSKMDADRKRATLDSIQRAENNLTAKIQDLKKKMQ